MTPAYLWDQLLPGYLTTIAVETPILLIGLSRPHSMSRRSLAGLWLTACTYPIVVLVLPLLIEPRVWYLIVAETFAPVAECVLFALAFHSSGLRPGFRVQDFIVITLANLASFLFGVWQSGW